MLLHFAGVKAFYTPKIYDESIIACPTLIAKRFLNISAEAFSFSVGGNSDSRLLLTADGYCRRELRFPTYPSRSDL